MNAQTAKITPAPYIVRTTSAGNPFVYIRGQKEPVCGIAHTDNGVQRAHLIAEAFNVYHETGLTPRQLADQRAELLEALRQIVTRYVELVNSGDCGSWNPEKELEVVDARSAIQHATGEQP